MAPLLEICIDSFESAVAAIRGGADRLEVCAALSEGGLTPSVGLLREIRSFVEGNQHPTRLYAMIRCRRGSDFCYSEHEMSIMLYDLRALAEAGADGFVFGALSERGDIHREQCRAVVAEAMALGGRPVTFHRAFDCTDRGKMRENLELVASLGFTTVLTSGFESTASAGIDEIAEMVKVATEIETPMTILPGSGVNPSNAQEIIRKTGCTAIHASARSLKKIATVNSLAMGGSADGEGLLVCDEAIVRNIKEQLNI